MANKLIKEAPKFKRKKKRPCPLTVDQINVLDHNSESELRRFISDRGKSYLVETLVYLLKNNVLL